MNNFKYSNRLNDLKAKLLKIDIDAVWIIQPENRRYLSGFKATDGQLTESSGSLIISHDQALLLTDSRYTTEAENESTGFEVITCKKGLVGILPSILEKMNVRKLGFESEYMLWNTCNKLKEKISNDTSPVELIPLSGIIEEMRTIKQPEEVEAIKKSAQLMRKVLLQVINELKPGQVERDLAWKIETILHEQGADRVAFPPIVASGPNSALPHAVPTNRKIKENEPVIFDVGAMIDGYCSDMTRTVFAGEPSPYFKKIYNTVREAQVSALKSIRVGMKSTEADSIARNIIQKAGFGDFFGHSLGHGIGLAPHEKPGVGPLRPEILKEGMVFTVEPGIYIPGKGGVRLEDMVILEKDGPRVLTNG